MKMLPTLAYEYALWERGVEYVIGMDEVGRGAFAGPVVAAAVIFPNNPVIHKQLHEMGIDDSKRLSAKQRQILAKQIQFTAYRYVLVEIPVGMINAIGIGKATAHAFRRAIKKILESIPEVKSVEGHVLVDGFAIPRLRPFSQRQQTAIVHGDQLSISIAAASIVAKVYRDSLMQGLDRQYPLYHWVSNKGYGTEEHRQAIVSYGITHLHRNAFVNTWQQHQRTVSITES
jgi:ribonuclease HII